MHAGEHFAAKLCLLFTHSQFFIDDTAWTQTPPTRTQPRSLAQMDDATYDDTAQGSAGNAAAHFAVPAGPGDPEERTIPSDAVADDAERAAAAQEHVSIDVHLARLATVHAASSTINETERVEAVRYVPAGKAAGNYLPLPLGKEGHPYREGWAWGWFQTRRLVRTQCKRHEFVDPTTPLFRRLAIEASRLDICYRSATQREVVCIALCIPELRSALYPTVPEPDILEICRTNATRLPAAIRRQYYVPTANGNVWSEFDVVDVSIYCGLHAARPQPKEGKQTQLRRWNEVLDHFFMEWLPLQTDVSMQPKFQPFPRGGEPYPNELPEDWKERTDMMYTVWGHLLACGFTTRAMRPPGEVWFYMARARRAERDRALLASNCRQQNKDAKQTEVRQWSTQWLVWPPMQYGRAAIRVKVSNAQRELYWHEYEEMFKDMQGRWAMHNEILTGEGLEPDVFYSEDKVCRPWIPLYTP
ncbi:hypothetical protein EXIGLDRAFT_700993 [Exidia glandulosa HHB12029]|uniref:Uncharacterized protein n=1 Tax=Exidia glandulosa HHB12029 TaxID=1314781 RepID=A0A165LXT8_EXIGL|nr:hypothetical protein EXIGLDRAFT_700993 [Exidia glandulosa HHB12029]